MLRLKSLWHRCFPVNFAKFLRITSLKNTSGRLLLIWQVTVLPRRNLEMLMNCAWYQNAWTETLLRSITKVPSICRQTWIRVVIRHVVEKPNKRKRSMIFAGALQTRIWSPVKHFQWSFFANSWKPLTIFVKKIHRRSSTDV